MNACEICGETFPNITELYKHKYRVHQKQSLVLHNHKAMQPAMEFRGEQPALQYREELPAAGYRKDQLALENKSSVELPQLKYRKELPVEVYKPKAIKRKIDYSDSENEYEAKRYRHASDSELEAIEYKPENKSALVPYKRKKRKPRRKFLKVKGEDEYNQVERMGDVEEVRYENRVEKIYKENVQDQRERYENKLAKRNNQLEQLKKHYEEYIVKGGNEFKEREDNLKKELEEYKNSSQTSINEMESYYQGQIKLLQEKIKSMGENKASFKPLSDAIFNCITIEEIFKIRKLVRNREFDVLVKNHLDTLQKLFLSLTYGVIPICQPQRDVLTENQKKLIEKIEISTPSKAKNVIIQNRSEIVNIFDVIDQSLELTAIAYDRFRKL